jgi:hypothetical protein
MSIAGDLDTEGKALFAVGVHLQRESQVAHPGIAK